MFTRQEKERIEELEAKAYFEWGISESEGEELDRLIRSISPDRGEARLGKEKEDEEK